MADRTMLRCATSVIALTITVFAAPFAAAQDAAPPPAETEDSSSPEAEIVVTGTSIRGIAPVGSPVLGFTEQDIEESGAINTVDFLRQVPQVVNIGADEGRVNSGAQNANANTMRASGINIRGLGPQATLTLIEGVRPAPAGLRVEFFDISAIPTIALSGIEIVADGASAIYGSDAIAGVANLRLRRNFHGLDLQGRYTFADGYDGYLVSGVFGRKWSSGDFMIAGEYYRHSAFFVGNRSNLFLGAGSPRETVAASTTLPRFLTDFTVPPNITAGGVSYALPSNPTGAPLTAAQVLPGANRRNQSSIWDGVSVLPEQRRFGVVGRFTQNIADGFELSGHAFYSKRNFDLAPQNATTPATTATFTVRSTNPYAAFLTGLPGAPTQASVRYSFINDFGNATFYGSEQVAQGVLTGRVDLFGDWQAAIGVAHSYSRAERFSPAINSCALTGTATNVSGPCTVTGGALGQTSLTTAFNPFGPNRADVLDRIRAYVQQKFTVNMTEYRAQVDGTLFTLPGGRVRAAAGVNYIDWTNTYLNFGNAATANNTIERQNSGGSADQTIASVFGEIVVPVFGADNAIGGFQSLSLSGALRYDKYSLYDDPTINPKLGVSWTPIDGLKLHGSYSTSFRSSIKDRDPENAPNVVARVNNYFDYSIGGNTTAISFTGGNVDVVPETSETYTFGFDFEPVRGLNLSATYFNIAYRNIIETSGQTVNTGIVSAEQESVYAPFITRRPAASDTAGTTAFNNRVAALLASPYFTGATIPTVASVRVLVDGRGVNAGTLLTDGLDLSASYAFEALGGRMNAEVNGTYYFTYKRSLSPTVAPVDRLNESDFPTTYRIRGGLSWANDSVRASAFVNHLPSYTNTYVTPAARVDAYTTVDATLAYTFNDQGSLLDGLSIGLNVKDLFDADPPYALTAEIQTFDSQNASYLGRTVSIEVRKRF